ncbi:MAG: toxin-activating protein [Caulobacter sp.]|nr:toxin-activating protein [Caulobacter sp.]
MTIAPPPGTPKTVAEAIGQIVWLLTQSPLHRELKLKAIETTFMPAVVHEQFRIFRFGPLPGLENADPASFGAIGMSKEGLEQLPLGVAIWAYLSPEAEAKVEAGQPLELADWKSGDRLWLLELISPFANEQNKLTHAMMFDLMGGPFKASPFRLHRTDPRTGKREKILVEEHLKTSPRPASAN